MKALSLLPWLWISGQAVRATSLESNNVTLVPNNNNNTTTNKTTIVATQKDPLDSNDIDDESDEYDSDDETVFQDAKMALEDSVDDNPSFIEVNPSYVGPPSDSDSDDSDSDDSDSDSDSEEDEYDDEEEEERDLDATLGMKKRIEQALLGSTNSTTRHKLKQVRNETVKLLRKHRGSLTVAACLFAFRKEIKHVLRTIFTTPVVDPQTGKIVRRPIRLNPTDTLKVVLFLDLMRRVLTMHSKSSSDPSQPSSGGGSQLVTTLALFLLKGGGMNPAATMFLLPLLLSRPSKSSVYLPPVEQHYTFETINNRYTQDGMAFQRAMELSRPRSAGRYGNFSSFSSSYKPLLQFAAGQQTFASPHKADSSLSPARPVYNDTTILLDMTQLDTSVSQISTIRDKVSFILREVTELRSKKDAECLPNQGHVEVAVLLESPGGSAPDYALAAQQLLRLRNHPNITVTVLVDKVAASGGYMIACASSPGKLYAAPFAVVGSIGVVGQAVNIQKTLEAWGVQPLVFRGGRDKAPVGLLGDITEEGLAKVQDMVDSTHRAFKRHVVEARPIMANNIEEVATGDTFIGYDAVDLGLVDGLTTSDEYIHDRIAQGALVLKLLKIKRPHYSLFKPATEGTDFGASSVLTVPGGLRALSNLVGSTGRLLNRAHSWMNSATAL